MFEQTFYRPHALGEGSWRIRLSTVGRRAFAVHGPIIIVIIIIHEYYYGGAVALLLQDHLTMSVSRFAG